LQRIARVNGPINAIVLVDREGAMKAARAADRALKAHKAGKKGAALGPLHGVPITIKEAFDIAGLPTTSSHRRSRTISPRPTPASWRDCVRPAR
jgi:amidase